MIFKLADGRRRAAGGGRQTADGRWRTGGGLGFDASQNSQVILFVSVY
ncbi:MAG: hypothetical protein R2830_05825 [Saprospiraceae bacterium]